MQDSHIEVNPLTGHRPVIKLPGPRRGWRWAWRVVIALATAGALVGYLFTTPGFTQFLRSHEIWAPAQKVTFLHVVPWGVLTVDGRTVRIAENSSLSIAPGRHTLDYQAPPFAELRCVLSVPAANGDTCGPNLSGGHFDFAMYPHELAAKEKNQLDQAVWQMLRSLRRASTVQPGDHFRMDPKFVGVAGAALPGYLEYYADHQGEYDPRSYELCTAGCPVAGEVETRGWVIEVKTGLTWTFPHPLSASGATAWVSGYSGGAIAMAVTWAGSWQVNLPAPRYLTSLVCEAAMNAAKAVIAQPSAATRHAGAGECLLSLPSPSDPSAPPLQLYFHNGAIMAADSFTHRQVPSLPVGSAHEQAAAHALLSAGP
ncbi:MAG TPA: hypothetical protein VF807_07550 [Ktedonobacterales bacterium]